VNEVSVRNVNDPVPIGQGDIGTILLPLQEIQQSTTMFMTLKPVVKDDNDYTCFSYYGRVVMDT
jgi:hypothetical protein